MMIRILVGISVLLNVLVLGIAVWLGTGGLSSLFRENFIEPNWQRLVSHFEVTPVQAGDVVFLGDSITQGGNWQELFPSTPLRNRGIGGDTTGGVLERLDQVTAGKPSKVFILIGTNDLAFGVSEDEIVNNLGVILERISGGSTDTRIYVQSVLPRADAYQQRVESLNESVLASLPGSVTFVDLYPHFLSEDGSIRDDLANDELHLMGDGYILWRNLIQEFVDAPL